MGLLAKDIMVQPVVTCGPKTSLRDAARLMLDRHVGSVVVTDDHGRVAGIVTESDFVGQRAGLPFSDMVWARLFGHYVSVDGLSELYREAANTSVSKIMTSPVAIVPPNATVEEVAELMVQRDVNRIPVVEAQTPIGIIARHDLLRVMFRA